MVSDRDRLREIKTFPSLVKYLRDELDWPIDTDDFDELTFEYQPEELGIDPKAAAKIKEIKQLRPLSSGQPWGIFFINFEPKRLPVVVLRRILRSLVIKKRQSARQADQPSWHLRDLLFISSYGEADDRGISFGNFSEGNQPTDLPTLRVLAWDDKDTVLHLGHAHETLKEKLRWPDDEGEHEVWRTAWSSAFVLRPREVIKTSKKLAVRMASLATQIRSRANTILAVETESGALRKLYKAFQEALIHDLNEDDFADMYAQTITYGLFAAACSRPAGLVADNLADMVPITNPFLKELLGTFLEVAGRKGHIDFDELGTNDVVQLLLDADLEAVQRDFGDLRREEDPVIHFYELFLKEYDSRKKIQRGVFYTPQAVVSFIVRSVDEILRTEFGLADGLADTTTWAEMAKKHKDIAIPEGTDPDSPFVVILDPATGTATFLVEVIDVIHKTMVAKWRKAGKADLYDIPKLWNDYVARHLLPRLHGYELMMAPYAIAHMKIGLKLFETGYTFGSDERARIYLTNALEPPRDLSDRLAFAVPALAHEAEAVNTVKQRRRFTVVVGNPPYAGHSSNNEIAWIVNLVRDFTRDEPSLQGPAQGKWLQDDYVKFLRFAQHTISVADLGVIGMITNHRYLTNRTFKGLRRQWTNAFQSIRLLDLHGNAVVNEISPVGYDENVFDIEQGVCIGLFARSGGKGAFTAYAEVWGNRETSDGKGKYDVLARSSQATTRWQRIDPRSPDFWFVAREEVDEGIREEFWGGLCLHELMPGALGPNRKPPSGLATMHDSFAISFSPEEVEGKVQALVNTASREEAKLKFGTLCNPGQWSYTDAKDVLSRSDWKKKLCRIHFAPFDIRYTIYDKSVCVHLRRRISDHLFGHANLALVVGEAGQEISGDEWDAVSCIDGLLQLNYFRRNGSPTIPLYLYDEQLALQHGGESPVRRPNFAPEQLGILAGAIGAGQGEMSFSEGLTPEMVAHYAFALLHSPQYRRRYAEFLKTGFPRLLVPSGMGLFRDLSTLGGTLVELHLMQSPLLSAPLATYDGPEQPQVRKVSYSDGTVWLGKAKTCGFKGVPEDVWNFHIGGYQVCQKWLKDRQAKGGKNPRPGRVLTEEDIDHYQKIVVALSETIRIMAEIDEVIEQHGGWPGAFITDPTVLEGLKPRET